MSDYEKHEYEKHETLTPNDAPSTPPANPDSGTGNESGDGGSSTTTTTSTTTE